MMHRKEEGRGFRDSDVSGQDELLVKTSFNTLFASQMRKIANSLCA